MSISGLSPGLGLGASNLTPYQSLYGNRQASSAGTAGASALGGVGGAAGTAGTSTLGGVGGTAGVNGTSANPLTSGLGGGNSIQGLGNGSLITVIQAILSLLSMILSMLLGGQSGAGNTGAGAAGGAGSPGGVSGNAGSPGNAENSGPPSTKGGGNIPSSNGSGVPDDQDENGKTAAQLNTTGPAGAVSDAEIAKAAGGDPEIEKQLKRLNTDVEGHKELRLALDKGTTYQRGQLPGSEIGLTETSSGHGPKITLESTSMDTVAHETAHAAYQDMSHAEVYRLGHRVEGRLGK